MSRNEDGVAELRSTVDELEATVRGLTEELVESNERIRALEARVEGESETPAENTDAPTKESNSPSRARAEDLKTPESKEDDNDTDESTLGDDIIVA